MVKRRRMRRSTRLRATKKPEIKHLKSIEEKVVKVHGRDINIKRLSVAVAGTGAFAVSLPMLMSIFGARSLILLPIFLGFTAFIRGEDFHNVKETLKYMYKLEEKEAHALTHHIHKKFKEYEKSLKKKL